MGIVQPRAGRVVMFTGGLENLHSVERLHVGSRHALQSWFTCAGFAQRCKMGWSSESVSSSYSPDLQHSWQESVFWWLRRRRLSVKSRIPIPDIECWMEPEDSNTSGHVPE